jgi:hypothetical protein
MNISLCFLSDLMFSRLGRDRSALNIDVFFIADLPGCVTQAGKKDAENQTD